LVVIITNITDAPGRNPTQVDVYNKTISPGGALRIPADLVTRKIRALEEAGLIAVGNLPSWYTAAKQRKGRALTPEEQAQRIVTPQPQLQVKSLKEASKEWKVVKLEVPELEEGTATNRKRQG
jgi:hypothetical protein